MFLVTLIVQIVQKLPIDDWKKPKTHSFICKPNDEWSNKWFYVWTTSLQPLNSKYLNFCKTKGGIFRVGSILPRAVTHLRCPDYWGTVAHELGVLGLKNRVALKLQIQSKVTARPKKIWISKLLNKSFHVLQVCWKKWICPKVIWSVPRNV